MKKITIHILAFFLTLLRRTASIFTPIIFWISQKMGRLLFSLILPFYNPYVLAKRFFLKFYSPLQKKHRLIHFFARRYMIHILIIVSALMVVSGNLNANEVKREDTGYRNILSRLVEKEDYDILQEERSSETALATMRYYRQNAIEKNVSPGSEPVALNEPEIVSSQGALMKPILSPMENIMRARNEMIYYIVEAGDTISDIGQRFGISVNTILWENNLTGYSIIRPGQKLAILPVSGIRYKIARGDTLQKISQKYSASIDDILAYNKLESIEEVRVGETLIIPGGKKPQTITSYALRWGSTAQQSIVQNTIMAGKLLWPSVCRRITQYFTWRHSGVDIACGKGNSVKAAGAGTVLRAQTGWNSGYGTIVIIDHGSGLQTLYGHLNALLVKVGDAVEKGQVIGLEGSTGKSTGPHVHFELRTISGRKNPLSSVK